MTLVRKENTGFDLFVFFSFVIFLKNFKNNFIYLLFLAVLGLRCYVGFSLVVESEGYSLAAVCRFLVWGLLLLQSMGSRAHGLSNCGSQALKHRLNGWGVWA